MGPVKLAAAAVWFLAACFSVEALEYSEKRVDSAVPGVVTVPATLSFDRSPEDLTHMVTGQTPLFLDQAGNRHIPWWNEKTGQLVVTVIDKAGRSRAVNLPGKTSYYWAAALSGDSYYYLTVTGGQDVSKTEPVVELVRSDLAGKLVKKVRLDTAIDQFDVWEADRMAAIDVMGDRVMVVVTRFYHDHGDGPSGQALHHQASFGAVFDTGTLQLVQRIGQLTGHSMDVRLTNDGQRFLALSLGDGYPRGLELFGVQDKDYDPAVVFTFKTKMGEGPSQYRPGLAGGRWSNDNNTYTEVGDAVALPTVIAVMVASEAGIDNENTQNTVNEARNLALVLVSPALPYTGEVISPRTVLSKGVDSPEFNFWSFDGNPVKQKQTGVLWLTRYTDIAAGHASHPKLVGLPDGRLVALWEQWNGKTYKTTWLRVLDPAGPDSSGGKDIDLGPTARLPLATRLTVEGNKVVWATPDKSGFLLHQLTLEPVSQAPSLAPWLRDPVYAEYRQKTLPAGLPWTVNAQGNLAAWADSRWQPVPGSARQVAVDLEGRAWRLAPAKSGDSPLSFWNGTSWTPTVASGVRVSFDGSGIPILQNSKGELGRFYLNDGKNLDSGEGNLFPVPRPPFSGVARDWASDPSLNTLWRLGPSTFPGGFEVFFSADGGPWTSAAVGASRVAVDGYGSPWLMTNKGQLLQGSVRPEGLDVAFNWTPVPGKVRDLFRGKDGVIQALAADTPEFHLLTWNGQEFIRQ